MRLAQAEALSEKLAEKLTRTQEEQLRKLEEYKAKYQIMQHELESKAERIRELECQSRTIDRSQEEKNNIRLLHQLKKAHQTIEDMKHVLEKADAKVSSNVRPSDRSHSTRPNWS
jgi:hypothetical protein